MDWVVVSTSKVRAKKAYLVQGNRTKSSFIAFYRNSTFSPFQTANVETAYAVYPRIFNMLSASCLGAKTQSLSVACG